MFDSVLDRGAVPRRRLATGAVVSVLGHAAVLSALLLMRPPPAEEAPQSTLPPLVILERPPPPPLVGGSGATGGPSRGTKRRALLAPAAIPHKLDLETFAPPDVGPDHEIAVGAKIEPGEDGPGGGGGGGGGDTGPGDPTCVGGACTNGITPPRLVGRGREPEFTHEALEAHVEGVMTIQCVVTLEGRLEQCQALRSLPFMEHAVVDALMTRRYSPATLHGRPLAVRYVFHVKLVMPR